MRYFVRNKYCVSTQHQITIEMIIFKNTSRKSKITAVNSMNNNTFLQIANKKLVFKMNIVSKYTNNIMYEEKRLKKNYSSLNVIGMQNKIIYNQAFITTSVYWA